MPTFPGPPINDPFVRGLKERSSSQGAIFGRRGRVVGNRPTEEFKNRPYTKWKSWFLSVKNSFDSLFYQSSCRVRKTSNQAINTGAARKLTWEATDKDVQGEVDLTNNKWVAKKDGDYVIIFSAGFGVAADQDGLRIYIVKNAAAVRRTRQVSSGTAAHTLSIITVLEDIDADDELEFYAENNANNDSVISNSQETFFEIYRIPNS